MPWNAQKLAAYPLLCPPVSSACTATSPTSPTVPTTSGSEPPPPAEQEQVDYATLHCARDVLTTVNLIFGAALPFIVSVDDPTRDRLRCPMYDRFRKVIPPTHGDVLSLPNYSMCCCSEAQNFWNSGFQAKTVFSIPKLFGPAVATGALKMVIFPAHGM